MKLNTEIVVDFKPLDKLLSKHEIPRDGYSRLMMNDNTVYALTGKHFYDVRRQTYYGFEIVQNQECAVGEVIVLVDYERIVRDAELKAAMAADAPVYGEV